MLALRIRLFDWRCKGRNHSKHPCQRWRQRPRTQKQNRRRSLIDHVRQRADTAIKTGDDRQNACRETVTTRRSQAHDEMLGTRRSRRDDHDETVMTRRSRHSGRSRQNAPDKTLATRRSPRDAHDVHMVRRKNVGGRISLSGSFSGFGFSIEDAVAGATQSIRLNVGDS